MSVQRCAWVPSIRQHQGLSGSQIWIELSAAASVRCSLSAEHRKHWLLCTKKATSLALVRHHMVHTFRGSSSLVPQSLPSRAKTPQGKLPSLYFQHLNFCKQTFPLQFPNMVFENLQLQLGRDTCILDSISKPPNLKNQKSTGFQVSLHKLTQMSKVSKERFSCHRKHKEQKISWYHTSKFQYSLIWSQQQSSSHSNWSEVNGNQELLFLSIFFFYFYVWLKKFEAQKTITVISWL